MAYKYHPPVQIRAEDGTALAINSAGNLTAHLTDGTHYSQLDSVEGAIVQVPLEHHMVHDGHLFMMSGRTADLGDGDSIDLILSVPNTATRIHSVLGFSCATAGYAEFWEDATALLAGSTLTAYNADRNSANETSVVIYNEPASITLAGAVRLQADQIGGGQQHRFGAEQRDDAEWILKQGSCYLTRYVSQAASNSVSFEIQYYEVE